MNKIKIGIAEDHRIYRKAIIEQIENEGDIEVLLEAENGKELLELLMTVTPDIILMDIRMPEMNGIEASEKVKKLYPNIKIIALSQYDMEANIIEMNIRGVKSFIGKEDDLDELFRAIRTVNDGGVYMTNHCAEIVQRYLSHISKYLKDYPNSICEQDKHFIKMIIEGLSSRQIGMKIDKSHRTVEDMRERLYLKFNVKSKSQLIALVSKWNLV